MTSVNLSMHDVNGIHVHADYHDTFTCYTLTATKGTTDEEPYPQAIQIYNRGGSFVFDMPNIATVQTVEWALKVDDLKKENGQLHAQNLRLEATVDAERAEAIRIADKAHALGSTIRAAIAFDPTDPINTLLKKCLEFTDEVEDV